MSPIGLGNDIGGSVRNPALCCGVAALKPGYGRVPRVASLPPTEPGISAQLMSAEGPMARTVADLRVAYEVLAGRVPTDPRVIDGALYGAPTAKRCGIVRSLEGTTVGTGALLAVNAAAAAMEAAGWEVIDIEVPELVATHHVWQRMLAFDFAETIPILETFMGDAEVALLKTLVAQASTLPGSPQQLFAERLRLQKAWAAMFVDTPVVIGPGWNNEPFHHGEDVAEGQQMSKRDDRLSFIVPANALGLPVVALANGTHDGLPVGVQVYSDHWREDLCLDAAAIVESASTITTPIDPVWN
ncbi:MAG: amidase family protein [Acidimicrobiales bacterium]